MSQPKPKAMPKYKISTAYKDGHTGVSNKTDQMQSESIEWKPGPKVDQLDVLVDIPKYHYGKVAGRVLELPLDIDELVRYVMKDSAHMNYQFGSGYKLGKTSLFTIRCHPCYKAPFMKITSCPAELLRTGKLITLWKLISYTFTDVTTSFWRPSRMDLTYDFHKSGQEIIWYSTRAKKSFVYPGSTWGTPYLGSNKGDLQIRIYDKANQLKQVKGVEIAQQHMLRLEMILRRKYLPKVFPAGLADMKNPLLGIRPYSRLGVITWLKKNDYADLVSDVFQDGLNEALAQIPVKERKAIVAALDKFAIPDWWNPENIWAELTVHAASHPVMDIFKGGKPTAT